MAVPGHAMSDVHAVLYRTVLCGQQMYESGVWERARIDYGSNWRYEINPNHFCVCVCVHVHTYVYMYVCMVGVEYGMECEWFED